MMPIDQACLLLGIQSNPFIDSVGLTHVCLLQPSSFCMSTMVQLFKNKIQRGVMLQKSLRQ